MEPKLPKSRFFIFLETHPVFSRCFIFILIFTVPYVHLFLWRAPSTFPSEIIFSVEKGQSVSSVANSLTDAHIISSPFLFKNLVIMLGRENGIKAGDYSFEKPISAYGVASRLTKAEYGLLPIKITIFEGLNIFEMASLFEKELIKFNSENFLALAKEGYLFPDTYFFLQNATESDVLSLMEKNFDKKIAKLNEKIKTFGKPLDEIVTMASILEEEARTTETREIISGILWKRIKIGMPLQVDVTFQYINGKTTEELTLSDLEIDSPYNTYKYKGFPPTPISNPGFDSLLAALSPKDTPYFYFLSGKDGIIYYATTFDEHKKNRALYLN
ncbi:endolytic transglycosylase MltG [Candidatus Parcubacteria bacterium]|nr:endolytic transglycosylase MltG [Candidatus Parcubacteria bacterium]